MKKARKGDVRRYAVSGRCIPGVADQDTSSNVNIEEVVDDVHVVII